MIGVVHGRLYRGRLMSCFYFFPELGGLFVRGLGVGSANGVCAPWRASVLFVIFWCRLKGIDLWLLLAGFRYQISEISGEWFRVSPSLGFAGLDGGWRGMHELGGRQNVNMAVRTVAQLFRSRDGLRVWTTERALIWRRQASQDGPIRGLFYSGIGSDDTRLV